MKMENTDYVQHFKEKSDFAQMDNTRKIFNFLEELIETER